MYTLLRSFGLTSTVCVCDPRQVCTLPTYFGFLMSEMSKMRIPRRRSWLTASRTLWVPQSSRPELPSPDTNSRLRYTDTSLCDAGQRNDLVTTGRDGLEMSHTTK